MKLQKWLILSALLVGASAQAAEEPAAKVSVQKTVEAAKKAAEEAREATHKAAAAAKIAMEKA